MRSLKQRRKETSPLRVLRRQLGSDARPLSVAKLAQLTGVPAPTLRSVEGGARTFNFELEQRLRSRGVNWDDKTRSWSFTYNASLPLSVELLTAFGRLGRGSPLFQQLDARAICIQTITLLDSAPARDYLACVLRLRDFLEQLRFEYKVEGIGDFVAETTPKIEWRETNSGARFLHKAYSFKNPPDPDQVYDLCYLQKPIKWDEAEQGESSSTVQPAA